MATPLITPIETQVHAILDAANVVHRRLGPGWDRSIYLAVLEIVLVDRGVATARCSLPLVRTGPRRQEGLLCDRETWVHVEGRVFAAAEIRPALRLARVDHAVLLQFTRTAVEFRVVFDRGAADQESAPTRRCAVEHAMVE
jgi:hypothetical protein